ncbi:uncharacterized protein [Ptychodera flava]|uniref:uncharacterized protein n=1 Tax=Ptychodera flava TaxID=63121 RepID=UPI00396A1EDA
MLRVFLVLCVVSSIMATGLNLGQEAKTWWTKQVYSTHYYTTGRLSEREVKYAGEAGFKSVFGVTNHTTPGRIGDEPVPTTDEIKQIATELAGLDFDIFPPEITTYKSMEAIEYFTAAVNDLPKPMLVYCTGSYMSTGTVLLYFLHMTQNEPSFEPKIYTEQFFQIGRAMGHDFDMEEDLIELVSEITGEPPIELRKEPNNEVEYYYLYWHAKFVSSDWFVAGQIREGHISAALDGGYKAIVNNRLGVTSPPDETPSQEEVTLLNIKDYTGTYLEGGRQSPDRLLETRLDPDKPNEYISPESETNFEDRNPGEFGDDIGQNEDDEREAMQASALPYLHMPFIQITAEIFYDYVDELEAASQHGPVIVHCWVGYRATLVALLAEGYFNCRDSDWAMTQAGLMGYHYGEGSDEHKVLQEVLDSMQCLDTSKSDKPLPHDVYRIVLMAAVFLRLFGT